MKLWRWFTSWTKTSRDEDIRQRRHVLQLLLPGVSLNLLEEAERGKPSALNSDDALKAIFKTELAHPQVSKAFQGLRDQLNGLDDVRTQALIWQALEADPDLAAMRERVLDHFLASSWFIDLLKTFESRGGSRAVLELPFLSLPSVSDVSRSAEEVNINLLAHRQSAFEALLSRDVFEFQERAQLTLEATSRLSPPPLHSEILVAVSKYLYASSQRIGPHPVNEASTPLLGLLNTMRRLVSSYPQHVFVLYATRQLEEWAYSIYPNLSIPQVKSGVDSAKESSKAPEENEKVTLSPEIVRSDVEELPATLDHQTTQRAKEEVEPSETKTAGEIKVAEVTEGATEITLSEEPAEERTVVEAAEDETLAQVEEEPAKRSIRFNPISALERVTPEERARLTPPVDQLASSQPTSWALPQEFVRSGLMIQRGETRSAWSHYDWRGRFAKSSPYPSSLPTHTSLSRLDGVLRQGGGLPLVRDEVMRLLSSVGLRLPEAWELQVLHACEFIDHLTAYWTRSSRSHLWSPSERRWVSPHRRCMVGLTGFWDDRLVSRHELVERRPEMVLDANQILSELAGEELEMFDFGVDVSGDPTVDFVEQDHAISPVQYAEELQETSYLSGQAVETQSEAYTDHAPATSADAELLSEGDEIETASAMNMEEAPSWEETEETNPQEEAEEVSSFEETQEMESEHSAENATLQWSMESMMGEEAEATPVTGVDVGAPDPDPVEVTDPEPAEDPEPVAPPMTGAEEPVETSPVEKETLQWSMESMMGEEAEATPVTGVDVGAPDPEPVEVTDPEPAVAEAPVATLQGGIESLSIAYQEIIRSQSEELQQLISILCAEKSGLKNELADRVGISRFKLMPELQGLNSALSTHGLSPLIESKFETSRTAPSSGFYLYWLG